MNKKIIIIGLIVAIVVIGGAVYFFNSANSPQTSTTTQTQSQTSPTAGTVTIQNMAFSPALVYVKVGEKVTWTNQDSVGHSATASDNSFDTGIMQQGQSGSVAFEKAGTYTYHCSVHPNMKGEIIVQ